jgi:phospholipase/lecithinase/hemolysin
MQNIRYKNNAHTPRTVWLVWLVLLVATPPLYADAPYSRLVVFGDSLSDPGNAFVFTGGIAVAPFQPIPGGAYAIGGHHFSNGRTWAEQLAKDLSLPDSGKPALRNPGIFTNYAFGGARAAPGSTALVDLSTQVTTFLGDFGNSASPDALYVIWIGGNDVRDALVAAFFDPTLATSIAIITSAVTTEAANIGALAGAGATQFLVLNAPNLALTPAVKELGPTAVFVATLLSGAYNAGLTAALDGLETAIPVIDIIRFDTFALLSTVADAPEDFGLENSMDSCITPGVIVGAICDKPKDFLFWDFIHPTKTTHRLIGEAVEDVLE